MARKGQLSIQDVLETDEEFINYIDANAHMLISLFHTKFNLKGVEIYSNYCGYCTAMANAVKKGKLDLGQEKVAMARAATDNIESLSRFKGKSEPCFMFIKNKRAIAILFGANQVELLKMVETEVAKLMKEQDRGVVSSEGYEIDEILPGETIKREIEMQADREHLEAAERLKTLTLAARKKRVNERLAFDVRRLNFIMFWPHCHQAHYDLYEKWDYVGISVYAKEEIQLNEDDVKEAFYMSDIDPNEACVHALMSGQALFVMFKMFDTDNRNFCKVLRYALYEEIPVPKEDVPLNKQPPLIPAFERYASISKTAREVRRDRYNAKVAKKKQEQEEKERIEREQARIKREQEEEKQRAEKERIESERMARIQAGLPADPEPEEEPEPEPGVEGEQTQQLEGEELEGEQLEGELAKASEPGPEEAIPEEEKVEVEEEFHSDVSVEDEDYIPPGGLFVPGLYTALNDLAKANVLAHFFPKIITKMTGAPLESEHLPPHVLIMVNVDKKQEVLQIVKQYGSEILNYGFFIGDDPFQAEFIAYTFRQYEKLERKVRYKDRIALAVSRKKSLTMLHLASFNPVYISLDNEAGEKDCLHLFPVGYGDDHQDEEVVEEEEVVEVPVVEAVPEPEPEPVIEEEEEEEEVED